MVTVLALLAMVILGPFLTAQVGPDAQRVNLTLPIGSQTLALSSWQIIIALLVLIIGAVVVVGAGLTFVLARLDRETARRQNQRPFPTISDLNGQYRD